MSNENAELIRRSYQASASGDLDGMLTLVDPEEALQVAGVRP